MSEEQKLEHFIELGDSIDWNNVPGGLAGFLTNF
jgi:hypothetical protein